MATAKKTTEKKPATKKPAVKKTASKPVAKKVIAKKPAVKKASTPKSTDVSAFERYKMIEVAAYYLAEKKGFSGSSADYWVIAEKELNKKLAKK